MASTCRWHPFTLEHLPLWGHFATNIFQINEFKAEWHFNNLLELHGAGVQKVSHDSSQSENVASDLHLQLQWNLY